MILFQRTLARLLWELSTAITKQPLANTGRTQESANSGKHALSSTTHPRRESLLTHYLIFLKVLHCLQYLKK